MLIDKKTTHGRPEQWEFSGFRHAVKIDGFETEYGPMSLLKLEFDKGEFTVRFASIERRNYVYSQISSDYHIRFIDMWSVENSASVKYRGYQPHYLCKELHRVLKYVDEPKKLPILNDLSDAVLIKLLAGKYSGLTGDALKTQAALFAQTLQVPKKLNPYLFYLHIT